ncbi:histidine kinase [Gordoniibacillus kamchatkensis]|uniref:Histidine kinase n=1 Tax=Gordoniibacillus kamchatkensis TaxID=1590651 RepID=A0ABR5AJZ2_9BACL|nr:helix-turn-helix transcriptional regulator [Paenibacillus sp. VKM B-2647]KIL41357.1 histidine kinase [Paenibacillus sp. VKM B-2647]
MEIIEVVRSRAPITGDHIAELLGVSRPTIRSDLALLVMLGYIDAKPKVGYFLGRWGSKQQQPVTALADIQVQKIMGIPVVLRETATVGDAVVSLFLENVGSLIVIDGAGALAGIVSRKDLLKVTFGNANASSVPLSMVMTRYPNIVSVSPEENVIDAAQKMIAHQVDSLPVVKPLQIPERSQAVEVVGRITKTSMTKLLLDFTLGAGKEE